MNSISFASVAPFTDPSNRMSASLDRVLVPAFPPAQ
jgi:hypothetical protein